jgi:hypothetical protein
VLRGGGDGEHGGEVRVRPGVRGGGAEPVPVRRARRLPPLGGLRERRPPDRERGGGAVPVRVGPRLPDDARRRARRLLLIAANLFRLLFSSSPTGGMVLLAVPEQLNTACMCPWTNGI